MPNSPDSSHHSFAIASCCCGSPSCNQHQQRCVFQTDDTQFTDTCELASPQQYSLNSAHCLPITRVPCSRRKTLAHVETHSKTKQYRTGQTATDLHDACGPNLVSSRKQLTGSVLITPESRMRPRRCNRSRSNEKPGEEIRPFVSAT